MNSVAGFQSKLKIGDWARSDLLPVGVSQIVAALGQIIGVRLLTEVLTPAVFGEIALILGVSTLVTSIVVHPTMQALLRYHAEYAHLGSSSPVERTAVQAILKNVWFALPVSIPLGILAVAAGWISIPVALLLLVLMAADGMQMVRTTIMNASRQHHRYGAWQIAESWGRPLLAYAATSWLGIHPEIVLSSFIAVTVGIYGVMRYTAGPAPGGTHVCHVDEGNLLRTFQSYARPLTPLGLLGWLSGMADRYMIGGLLSVQSVGMYAAVYGLASRPILMLSSIAETSIRPVYYSAVMRKDLQESRKHLVLWFAIVFCSGTALCVLFSLFHHELAKLLLGPAFREASYLMPWIAGGYVLFALYHIAVRVCLAHDAPHLVTATEAGRAVLALAIGFLFIKMYGLYGAAIAVPIYCGVQLLASVYLARRSVRSRREQPAAAAV
ncbi:MAG: lipopolysaccharide biosynthesis protein [Nitrospirae bacterium]|nr:lipopolysaccharide biosynthesis protein [Nitrospirota bacterium]